MSLPTAQKFAWSLAKTLMTCVVLIQTGDGYAAMTEGDYDGDPMLIRMHSVKAARGYT